MDKVKINQMARKFGTSLATSGFQIIRNSYRGLNPVIKGFGYVENPIQQISDIPVVIRDLNYYFTSQENCEQFFDIIYDIVRNFKWEKELFDCDDRAKFIAGLTSLLFRLNTCGEVYCEFTRLSTGKRILHWANMAVTHDGKCIFFDADNGGRRMVLEVGKPITMGDKSYKLISARY